MRAQYKEQVSGEGGRGVEGSRPSRLSVEAPLFALMGAPQRVATPINLYSWLFRSRGTHRAATESLCIRCARKTFLQSEFERGGIHPRGWRFAGPRGRNPRSLGLRGKLQHASGVCVTPPWGHMVEWVPVYDIDRPPYPPQSCSNVVRSTAEVSQGSGGCSP